MTKGKVHRPRALFQVAKVLWHLDIFRRSFRDLSGHACMAESCIFCALKELFAQLQFSHETALPPDALRRALAESFFDQQRFQLGFMDDAAECFENMLLRIHMHIANEEAEDMCSARHCIPHQKFAMTLVEQSICRACGATSEPLSFTQMVHYVSASALTTQMRQNMSSVVGHVFPNSFGDLLCKAGSMGDIRDCPSSCGAKIQICRTLMNRPEIVSVGIVWDSERPTLEHIMDVFATVGTTLKLGEIFHSVVDSRWAEITSHHLVGVVTYYGKHYSTFFFHSKLKVWIYFDDATVKEVGSKWEQVVEKCRKGRYQPLLLLYAVPTGTPVSTDNAPKLVTSLHSDRTLTKKPPIQSFLRRSITPSPEKPNIGNMRRAITPNPDGSLNHALETSNEYQNLSVIQSNLCGARTKSDVDVVDCVRRMSPDYNSRTFPTKVSQVTVQRTNSSGSSSGIEAGGNENFCGSRRRDSGSWSGDRNSASSCSSTTMENPYLYLVGKVPNRNNAIPSSPTRTKCDSSSSSAVYDAGYDSYSLSSNDSTTMSTIQHLMKMGHLAKIPEDYSNNSASPSLSCDTLCDEADELLVKSRQLEDEHDLVLALALCNAAATKARAAMNAPYNNPQILTLARMKHNTCIMRARSLHRRMTQTQSAAENPPEIRHTREGSSGSGRHSRQNSRDKTSHSRQNSRELLVQPPQENTYPQAKKNIEIYATLPKRKDGLKNKTVNINIGEDEEYMLYDKPAREARSIFSRSKNKEVNKTREKRSRSEDRSKISGDFSIASEIVVEPNTDKKIKEEEKKDGKNKKQHKIRRKLLMGGLIKRKNRSMPDLTEASNNEKRPIKPTSSVDDSNVGVAKSEKLSSMCGYLSEGHLEFTGTGTNPNLERSRLMRKSFHGSAGKVLTAAKVPPPPPLRTTSQLSSSKLNEHVCDSKQDSYYVYRKEPISLPSNYVSQNSAATRNIRSYENHYGCTPEGTVTSYDTNTVQTLNTVITRADVHQEQSPHRKEYFDQVQPPTDIGVDEVDCFVQRNSPANLDLPPYPSPANSVVHSRQPSEDFPPPPPPLDLSALDEHLVDNHTSTPTIMHHHPQDIPSTKNSGDTWLHELQARQAALKAKKAESAELGIDVVNTQKCTDKNGSSKINSVRDLASRFENIQLEPANKNPTTAIIPKLVQNGNIVNELDKNISHAGIVSLKKWGENEALQSPHLPVEQKNQEIIHCAEEKSGLVNDTSKKLKVGKKKSVSFCDQVILVATAEEQEDDSYIPNPILERVLRSAINKPETAAIQQEILRLREAEQKKNELNKLAVQSVTPEPRDIYNMETNNFDTQSRQNSTENLLNKTTLPVSNEIQQSQQMNAVNSQYGAQYMPVQNAQRVHQTTAYNAQTLHRESPYQQMQYPFKGIPHVTGAYPAPNQQQSPASQPYNCDLNTENVQYGPPQRNINVQNQNMRSSPCQPYPLPCQQYMHPGYPHQQFTRNPNPSPSPSVCNEYYPQNQGTHNVYQTGPSGNGTNYTPYHKVPMPPQQATPPYQQVPYNTQQQYYQQNFQRTVNYNDQNGSQMAPGEEVYYSQRPARSTNCINYPNGAYNNGQDMGKYSPYQHVLPPKQMPNKYVGAENGPRTCGEQQSVPVGGKINGQLQVKNKCNLCRKKLVTAPNSYCMDCEFYMSRFKPKN